ncbi:MAG: GyrI-like domain-containing protein [Bacteroidales bacterium]
MVPRIETLIAKKLIGKRMTMTFSNDKTFELWSSFMPLKKEINNVVNTDLFSLQIYPPGFFDSFNPTMTFEKWAAVEVNDFNSVPGDFLTLNLPGGLYAIFPYKGLPAEAAGTFQFIFGTWIPNSGYSLDNRPHFEILGEKYKPDDPNSEEEIWIPIKPKI